MQGYELDYVKVLKSRRRPQGALSRNSTSYMKIFQKEIDVDTEIERLLGCRSMSFRQYALQCGAGSLCEGSECAVAYG
jgi:hypothetical protein